MQPSLYIMDGDKKKKKQENDKNKNKNEIMMINYFLIYKYYNCNKLKINT